MTNFDKLSKPLAEFLTSTLFVILVMLAFMFGIVSHLNDVFESWFLATGFQCVVLIASVNSEILPKVTLSKKYIAAENRYETKEMPAIALIMSIFMLWFISISFGVIESAKNGEWVDFTVAITKALATSSMELMFSYLFNARWNSDKERFKESLINMTKKVDPIELDKLENKVDEAINEDFSESSESENEIKVPSMESASPRVIKSRSGGYI